MEELIIEKLEVMIEPETDVKADCTQGKWVGSNQADHEALHSANMGPGGCTYQTCWTIW